MSNDFDGNVKLLYPVDDGFSFFTVDDVARGATFDVIANVEVGADLNAIIDSHEVRVGIVNLTQSRPVGASQLFSETLTPAKAPLLRELRIDIPGGWNADAEVGDVLQAVASYKVTAGAHVDFSTAQSVTFVVS
jgi:hypothetical protein